MAAKVSQAREMLLIDHVKATSCANSQHDTQIEQVHLLQLVDRIDVDARLNTRLVQTVVLIHEVAEFVADQLGLACEILDVATEDLGQA